MEKMKTEPGNRKRLGMNSGNVVKPNEMVTSLAQLLLVSGEEGMDGMICRPSCLFPADYLRGIANWGHTH